MANCYFLSEFFPPPQCNAFLYATRATNTV